MTNAELMVLGVVSQLPPEQQQVYQETLAKMQELMPDNNDIAKTLAFGKFCFEVDARE